MRSKRRPVRHNTRERLPSHMVRTFLATSLARSGMIFSKGVLKINLFADK
jgi:hypothetical protein